MSGLCRCDRILHMLALLVAADMSFLGTLGQEDMGPIEQGFLAFDAGQDRQIRTFLSDPQPYSAATTLTLLNNLRTMSDAVCEEGLKEDEGAYADQVKADSQFLRRILDAKFEFEMNKHAQPDARTRLSIGLPRQISADMATELLGTTLIIADGAELLESLVYAVAPYPAKLLAQFVLLVERLGDAECEAKMELKYMPMIEISDDYGESSYGKDVAREERYTKVIEDVKTTWKLIRWKLTSGDLPPKPPKVSRMHEVSEPLDWFGDYFEDDEPPPKPQPRPAENRCWQCGRCC